MAVNNPDKIVFVGEALVGNEAVDQLTKFDRALRDFSLTAGGSAKGRGIDGMIVTKWDTVDDKVRVFPHPQHYLTGSVIEGWGGAFHDLRDWPTHYIYWNWTGW